MLADEETCSRWLATPGPSRATVPAVPGDRRTGHVREAPSRLLAVDCELSTVDSWPWALLALACIVCALFPGCGGDHTPKVVSAEFLDETPDAVALQDESIVLTLDRPLPADVPLARVKIRSMPPEAPWTKEVTRTSNPRVLKIRIVEGTPAFRFGGIFGRDPAATGLAVDLGDGAEQWVDLQLVPSLPVLKRAIWSDRSPPGGNMVVDRGDCIRLIFDRAVMLRARDAEDLRVRCPQDILLSKDNDRLDDGNAYAVFESGSDDREVLLVLGSRPVLTISGNLGSPSGFDRSSLSTPSGLALCGTRILPMPKITDRRGGPGAISLGEVDIEYEEGFPLPRSRRKDHLPAPGNRIFHTLTPIVGARAIVAGGATAEEREALDQILVYDPFSERLDKGEPFAMVGKLPHPAYFHTCVSLPGRDGLLRTLDDIILLAGGTDGTRSLEDLTLLRPREDGGVDVTPLETGLRIPRAEHAAVALPGNRVLIDGGKSGGWGGPSGLVGCAELITLVFEGGRIQVGEHVLFRSLPRMRHTLTLLSPSVTDEVYVLAYGGYGQPRQKRSQEEISFGQLVEGAIPANLFFPTDEGAVLASPVLLNATAPTASITRIPMEFNLSLLRWGHAAVPLGSDDGQRSAAEGASTVLIAGGTVWHLLGGLDRSWRQWDITAIENLSSLPRGHEATNALLFRFDPSEPSRSRMEIIPHPSPNPEKALERVCFSTVSVPGQGVFLLGGEQPGEGRPLTTAEIFLRDGERLADLAVRLTAGRSRHQAYLVATSEGRSIFLIGGLPAAEDRTAFAAVEEIRLK